MKNYSNLLKFVINKVEKIRLKILLILLSSIVLSISFSMGCSTNFEDCYDCQRDTGGYWSSLGWVTEYETTLACSDKEADKLIRDGWECPEYNK